MTPVRVLCVTAFKDIGRGDWDTMFKRTTDEYLERFSRLCKYPIELVCYCEDTIASQLPSQPNLRIFPYDAESTFVSKYAEHEKKILESPTFHQLTLSVADHPESKAYGYNLVTNSKICFMKRAEETFPEYDYYCWIDFGYCVDDHVPTEIRWDRAIQESESKILFCCHTPLSPETIRSPFENIYYHIESLQGNVWLVPKDKVDWFYKKWDKMMKEFYDFGITDDDQGIVTQIIRGHPIMFKTFVMGYGNWCQFFKQITV